MLHSHVFMKRMIPFKLIHSFMQMEADSHMPEHAVGEAGVTLSPKVVYSRQHGLWFARCPLVALRQRMCLRIGLFQLAAKLFSAIEAAAC